MQTTAYTLARSKSTGSCQRILPKALEIEKADTFCSSASDKSRSTVGLGLTSNAQWLGRSSAVRSQAGREAFCVWAASAAGGSASTAALTATSGERSASTAALKSSPACLPAATTVLVSVAGDGPDVQGASNGPEVRAGVTATGIGQFAAVDACSQLRGNR